MNARRVQRLTYTVNEAAAASRLSRNTLYRLMERGELRSVKIGERRLIPAAELERLCGVPSAAQGRLQERTQEASAT